MTPHNSISQTDHPLIHHSSIISQPNRSPFDTSQLDHQPAIHIILWHITVPSSASQTVHPLIHHGFIISQPNRPSFNTSQFHHQSPKQITFWYITAPPANQTNQILVHHNSTISQTNRLPSVIHLIALPLVPATRSTAKVHVLLLFHRGTLLTAQSYLKDFTCLGSLPGWSCGVDKANVRKSQFFLKQESECTANIISCASCKESITLIRQQQFMCHRMSG